MASIAAGHDPSRLKAGPFACGACGHSSPRWFGRCPDCGEWSSAARVAVPHSGAAEAAEVVPLSTGAGPQRFSTGTAELDRILGGGLVAGGTVLLAGEPGIGKSTLMLQVLAGVGAAGRTPLLVAGEESPAQIGARAARLGLDPGAIRAAATTSLPAVLAAAALHRADVLVVDSIHTLGDPAIDAPTGSLVQVRECTAALVRHAKQTGVCVLLVGHVTKDGGIAGPKLLEHVVDAVVTLDGERHGTLRFVRVAKNRFGACDETGVFTMSVDGLKPVPDPSAMLLADRCPGVAGSVVFCGMDGSRPLLVELQALVPKSDLPQPRRVAIGVDARRLSLLLGVLSAHTRLVFDKLDVFVAAAGGVRVGEPAADLAICLALISAACGLAVDPGLVAAGEIGLSGEVRRVPGVERRLAEAGRMGFTTGLVPRDARGRGSGVRLLPVPNVGAALDHVTGAGGAS